MRATTCEDTNARRCQELTGYEESCKLLEWELAEAANTTLEQDWLCVRKIEDANAWIEESMERG